MGGGGLQDTPSVKSTYEAGVRVPKPLTALMSAVPVGEPVTDGDNTVFSFKQEVRQTDIG